MIQGSAYLEIHRPRNNNKHLLNVMNVTDILITEVCHVGSLKYWCEGIFQGWNLCPLLFPGGDDHMLNYI